MNAAYILVFVAAAHASGSLSSATSSSSESDLPLSLKEMKTAKVPESVLAHLRAKQARPTSKMENTKATKSSSYAKGGNNVQDDGGDENVGYIMHADNTTCAYVEWLDLYTDE